MAVHGHLAAAEQEKETRRLTQPENSSQAYIIMSYRVWSYLPCCIRHKHIRCFLERVFSFKYDLVFFKKYRFEVQVQ